MPLFQITRPVPGWNDDELEAAGVRAQTCVGSFEGLRWVRSFLDAEHEVVTCIYEAPDAQSIRHHAAVSELPCTDIREVSESVPLAEPEPEPALNLLNGAAAQLALP